MTVSTSPQMDGFTRDDYEALPDDGKQYELIGGSIVMLPPPHLDHQRASRRLQRALEDAFGPAYEVFDAPVGLDLPTGDLLEPDLVVVEAGRDTRYIAMPVTLVVEIVSPGNARHDTVTKLDAYERGGVDNCWMVDTRADGRRFHAVQLVDGRYETVAVSARTIDVTDPVKLELPLDDLFRTD